LNSQEMKKNAMPLSKKIRAEDGVETAIKLIEEKFKKI